jgi:hypothetical protein
LLLVDLPAQFGVQAQVSALEDYPPESTAIPHNSVLAATRSIVLLEGLRLFSPVGADFPLCVADRNPVPPHVWRPMF